ncbi:Eco57I restriction-modification methylase domain-containing protein [Methanonatronarchaeum sp. AMET6-2]|uniref:Eco57I restriction-modification methylase domain-containing protein n=1 Tax=Methanonatronarchaeum sp. AMET6-2 TaxID=2933293 RepID=UPI001FF15D06|nr:N-6 DNA methylase [Methanonatronarchaeum sp. AMET6-2]UOY10609.1 N-6 DNA methylase [Methanonatronarchaeum sp. AMET6-2]
MPSNQHSLFDEHLVEEYLEQQIVQKPTNTDNITEIINEWDAPESVALGERNLQGAFNSDIFSEILDYKRPRPGSQEFQLFPEQYAETGEGFPDVLLGHFTQAEHGNGLDKDIRKVVGELKEPGTDLDKVDPSRLKSPVEQAFEYAVTNGLAVRWVIVTNMEEIRLYHHGSKDHYKSWDVSDFLNDSGELSRDFWEFYFIMHRDYLIGEEDGESQVQNLLQRNLAERLELTEGFYEFYRDAVEDVYVKIADANPELVDTSSGQVKVIQAAQKLLHRGLVICFFSDHPSNLLPDDLLREVVETGKNLPTLDKPKIYPLVKDLFRVIDVGSPDEYPYDIYGYDGGLFEEDEILNSIELPDELFTKEYEIRTNGDLEYVLEGVFGFHKLNFHTELNEHVLGRIFEESVSDIEQIRANLAEGEDNPFSGNRGDYGLYFTREGLTEFVAQQAIEDILEQKRRKVREEVGVTGDDIDPDNPDSEFLEAYLDAITDIRIVDIACGSGAFLVSCFNHLSREARRVHEKLREQELREQGEVQTTLGSYAQTEVDILDKCLHGNDILQESIEISKLSVWLRSARKEKSLAELTGNFASEDALAGELTFEDSDGDVGFDEFDLVIGNPPWGGEVSKEAYRWLHDEFGDEWDVENLDTYELFILISLKYLKDSGRLAFVLPQTLLNPDHSGVREYLLENYTFERYHILGADWFGPDIRINTTVLQVRNEEPDDEDTFRSMTLVDDDRRAAIEGELSLSQLESAYAFDIPQSRCIEFGEIEPFRYTTDDELLATMQANSIPLGALCESHRGVELNKAGHIIKCPACGVWMPPPRGRDPDTEKTCPDCETDFEYQDRLGEEYIVSEDSADGDVLYMDGDSFGERYDNLELKGLDTGYNGIQYKNEDIYQGDKVFIRQAGVGLSVAYHGDTVYCPQSVYIYKIREGRRSMLEWYIDLDEEDSEYDGKWTNPENVPSGLDTETYHKFLLGVLNSRVFHYYVFKRFGEIDGAQAFAKLTQTKIRSLPIPVAQLTTSEGVETAEQIASCVDELIDGEGELGGETDWEIEQALQDLYGLEGSDMVHISSQMGLVAYHQTMQELYPEGKPSPPERKDEISLAAETIEADD